MQERCKTYFVDVDGVIYKNRGKYSTPSWDDAPDVLDHNIQQLKRLYDNGAQIVIVTSRSQKYRAQIEKTLTDAGIFPHEFVMSCNHSQRVIINDFAPTNPYPSCVAISLPRDASLENYLEE